MSKLSHSVAVSLCNTWNIRDIIRHIGAADGVAAVDAIVVEVLRCHEVEVAYHTVEGKRVLLPLRYEQRAGQDLT